MKKAVFFIIFLLLLPAVSSAQEITISSHLKSHFNTIFTQKEQKQIKADIMTSIKAVAKVFSVKIGKNAFAPNIDFMSRLARHKKGIKILVKFYALVDPLKSVQSAFVAEYVIQANRYYPQIRVEVRDVLTHKLFEVFNYIAIKTRTFKTRCSRYCKCPKGYTCKMTQCVNK